MQFKFLTKKNSFISLICSAVCLVAGYVIKKEYNKYSAKKKALKEKYACDQIFYDRITSEASFNTSNEYFIKRLKNHTKYLNENDISLLSEIMERYNTFIVEHGSYTVSDNPNDLNHRCHKMDSIKSKAKHIYDVLASDDKESIKALMISLYTEEKVREENQERADKLRAERQAHDEHMAKINADKEIELKKLSNERYKYSQLAGTAKAFIESKKSNDDE